MNLNHLNLSVKDVAEARTFFQTWFQFQAIDIKANDTLSVLKGENGFVLVLMNEKMNQNGNNAYPDAFHIGFYLADESRVNDFYDKLKSGGVSVGQEPHKIRKTYGFYFNFQNLLIEVSCEIAE